MRLCRCVPDPQAFILKCRDVIEYRIQERIAVFHLLWAWNKPCRDDKPFLVVQVRRQVVDDIDKDPTVRVFVAVELSTIKRELHKNIIILDCPSFDSFQIIATAGSVIVLPDLPTMRSGIL